MTARYSPTNDLTALQRRNGSGHASSWICWGCQQPRFSFIGSRGVGVRKRCAQCVAKGAA